MAERMRNLRAGAGLTKTSLARPKYTVSFVSQIEAGRRRPSPEALEFFAKQLGVSAQYLATGVPEDLERDLRFRLQEAEHSLLQDEAAAAAETLLSIRARAAEYGLEAIKQRALVLLGEARVRQGKTHEAIELLEEARGGDLSDHDEGSAVWALARAYRALGDLAYAVDVVESFLRKGERGPLDPTVAAQLQSVLVSIYFERGDITRASRAAERAVAAAKQGASTEIRAEAFWHASRVLAEAKRWDEALDYANRARALMEELEDRRSMGQVHTAYAFICLETDPPRIEEAREHLLDAERILSDAGSRGDLAYVYTERSRLALLEGNFDESLRYADAAIADCLPEDELEMARCVFRKGRALAALKRADEARAVLRDAAETFGRLGARQQEAACLRELGEVELVAGDQPAALDAFRQGLEALDPARTRV